MSYRHTQLNQKASLELKSVYVGDYFGEACFFEDCSLHPYSAQVVLYYSSHKIF